jgi:hypothetical protein
MDRLLSNLDNTSEHISIFNSQFETDIKENEHNKMFKDLHNPLVKAIWNIDRFNPNITEKLRELKKMLIHYNPNMLCDIYHDVTGEPIAQATPLIIG